MGSVHVLGVISHPDSLTFVSDRRRLARTHTHLRAFPELQMQANTV
jgi:hypothetical protein